MRPATIGKELVVRTENRVGLLADIAKLLSTQGINILAVAVFVQNEEAELHLVVDAHHYALESLRAAEFPTEEREVVLVELPNRSG
ncbi:ACT domain-containing protein, partial [Candidatus Bipolaricaulota bacterium]|nr:ACT domain-containing protein [Candidatus Bipolaricaulota bacterium]